MKKIFTILILVLITGCLGLQSYLFYKYSPKDTRNSSKVYIEKHTQSKSFDISDFEITEEDETETESKLEFTTLNFDFFHLVEFSLQQFCLKHNSLCFSNHALSPNYGSNLYLIIRNFRI